MLVFWNTATVCVIGQEIALLNIKEKWLIGKNWKNSKKEIGYVTNASNFFHISNKTSHSATNGCDFTSLPPIDRDFFKDMFANFADTMDKRIEDIIEKNMVKVEKKEKRNKRRMMNIRMTEALIDYYVKKKFPSKQSGLLEQSGFLWNIIVV